MSSRVIHIPKLETTTDISYPSLSSGQKNGVVTATEVPQKLFPTPLTGRKSWIARIWGSDIVYVGEATIDSTTGYPKVQYEEIFADTENNISLDIYVVCAAGETCEIRTWELG